MMARPANFHEFTPHQYRVFMRLRRGERLPTARMRRETIDALVCSGVAFELDAGWLQGGPAAMSAKLLTGNRIQIACVTCGGTGRVATEPGSYDQGRVECPDCRTE